jgi:uncharacterized protein YqgV (UPF0045/DUF77 family)
MFDTAITDELLSTTRAVRKRLDLERAVDPQVILDCIALAQSSGLHYEVNALGTTIEGPPDDVWSLIRGMHESCLESGAELVVTVLKIAQHADTAAEPTMDGLTGKFRT